VLYDQSSVTDMKLIVLGSDGLWEFLSPQAVIDVCAQVQ
jgi:serine/threonine protein phosphatase PrpC